MSIVILDCSVSGLDEPVEHEFWKDLTHVVVGEGFSLSSSGGASSENSGDVSNDRVRLIVMWSDVSF